MPQAAPLTIVRRGAADAPPPLAIVKRGGVPVEPDFRSGVVADMPEDDWAPRLARGAWDYVTGAAETFNPLPAFDALGRALIPERAGDALGLNTGKKSFISGGQKTGPINFFKNAFDAQARVLEKARASWAEDDPQNATMHFVNWLTPFLGPALDEAYSGGDPKDGASKRAGRVTGILAQLFAPKAVSAVASDVRVPALGKTNAALSPDDLAFAADNQIPIDAATATGAGPVRNIQKILGETVGGAGRAERFRASQDAALQSTGNRLGGEIRPADWTPERAGARLRQRLEDNIGESRAEAGDAYDKLRAMEDDPANATTIETRPEIKKTTSDGRSAVLQEGASRTVPLAVDLSKAEAGLRPLFDELVAKKELTGALHGAEGRVLVALDSILNKTEKVRPLSEVDAALGELKAIARGDGPPTRGRAAAMKAVREVSAQIDETLKARPEARRALQEGRAATRAKYEALETLDQLRDEPVQAFKNLMSSDDASIGKLRALSKFVGPDDMATLGRAWLQNQLEMVANRERGWARVRSDWNKVGTETRKMVLGKNAGLARELDSFFNVAAEMEKNPNPSGSALTWWSGGQGMLLVTDPLSGAGSIIGSNLLSKFLYSREGVQLLTRGMRTPSLRKAATAAIAADVATMSERLGGRLEPAPAPGAKKERP